MSTDSAAKDGTYVVIHLVVQETTKPLVGPQVLDNMESQMTTPGPARPTRVIVVLLEPFRALFNPDVRRAVRALRARAPGVTVSLLPYVSRLSVPQNASILAHFVKTYSRGLPVVFHCRGERAVEWAQSLSQHNSRAAIIADIRGPWPEEQLFAQSRSNKSAEFSSRRDYDRATRNLVAVLGASQRATTVSDGMREWLAGLGVARTKMSYVPCCVQKITYDARTREQMRDRLGLSRNFVLVYAGVANHFQYLTDGLGEFVARALEVDASVHFMAITPDRRNMAALLTDAGVDPARTSIFHLPQERVATHLMAADAGLILGKPGVLKTVVQPVKFGEYLAAGLPVIASRGTLGIDRLIIEYRAGTLVDYPQEEWSQDEVRRALDTVSTARDSLHSGALTLCREHFLWDRYATVQREAYVDALAIARFGATCLRLDDPAPANMLDRVAP